MSLRVDVHVSMRTLFRAAAWEHQCTYAPSVSLDDIGLGSERVKQLQKERGTRFYRERKRERERERERSGQMPLQAFGFKMTEVCP